MAGTIAVIGLVISLLAASFVYWQAALSRRSMGAETLLHLDDVWRSGRMLRTRSAAAAVLVDKRSTGKTAQALYASDQSDVDEVLDFFETLAFFCRRNVLDHKLVWNMFYWPMENYWLACSDYVEHVRLNEGRHTWENFYLLRPKLQKLNRGDAAANGAKVPQFLRVEAALSPKSNPSS